MREFFKQFEEYCKTSGIEDSNKAKFYSKAIEYLCDNGVITKEEATIATVKKEQRG